MKKVRSLKGWSICKLNVKEIEEYGFNFAVIHPDNFDCLACLSPSDSDIECDTIDQAIEWIKFYNKV